MIAFAVTSTARLAFDPKLKRTRGREYLSLAVKPH